LKTKGVLLLPGADQARATAVVKNRTAAAGLRRRRRGRLRGAFWSAPAERSSDGALAFGQPLARLSKAESRFACLRTPNHGRLDGIR